MGDGADDGDEPITSAANVGIAFMVDSDDDGDDPTISAKNIDDAFMGGDVDDGDEPVISAANADDAFMGGGVDDGDEPAISAANVDTGMDETHCTVNEDVTTTAISFKDEYAKSIKPVMAKVDSVFTRSMRSGIPIATHPPASDDDPRKYLGNLVED